MLPSRLLSQQIMSTGNQLPTTQQAVPVRTMVKHPLGIHLGKQSRWKPVLQISSEIVCAVS